MKKLTAMLLCLAMLFAFAGCGSKDTGSGSNAGTAKKGVTEDVLPRLDIKSDVTVPDDFKMSVNLTNESLEWDGIEACIENVVQKYQFPNVQFGLEITEQASAKTANATTPLLTLPRTRAARLYSQIPSVMSPS